MIILGAWKCTEPYWIELLLQDLKEEQRLSQWELQHYRIDIAALSETQIADKGSLR